MGTIISCPGPEQFEYGTELGCIPEAEPYDGGWWLPQCGQVVMENGWTRFVSLAFCSFLQILTIRSLDSSAIEYRLRIAGGGLSFVARQAWLAQASHIFNRLGITSNHQDYGEFTE